MGTNGSTKIMGLLLAGGLLGGGAGTLGGALASDQKIRELVESSPGVAVVKAVQAEIRADVADLREGQREIRREQRENTRKLDRLLVIVEDGRTR